MLPQRGRLFTSLRRTSLRTGLFVLLISLVVLAACAPVATQAPAQAPAQATSAPQPTVVQPTTAPVVPTSGAAQSTTAPMSMAASLKVVSNETLGAFLADAEGRTLYLFTKDTPNTSNCYDKCAEAWPPLLSEGAPAGGDGLDAQLLGTTQRKDGKMQVTYNGWPLYYWFKDTKPGDTLGQWVNNVWFVVSPQGEMIKKGEPPATAAPTGAAQPTPAAATTAQPAGAVAEVALQNFSYSPKELKIAVGTTVTWKNVDSVMHTVTADDGQFASDLLAPNAEFSFTFTQPGAYPYYCEPHGGPGGKGMSATVIVE